MPAPLGDDRITTIGVLHERGVSNGTIARDDGAAVGAAALVVGRASAAFKAGVRREQARVRQARHREQHPEAAKAVAVATGREPERLGQVWTMPGPGDADRKLRDVRGNAIPVSPKLASGTGEAAFLERKELDREKEEAFLARGLDSNGGSVVELPDGSKVGWWPLYGLPELR